MIVTTQVLEIVLRVEDQERLHTDQESAHLLEMFLIGVPEKEQEHHLEPDHHREHDHPHGHDHHHAPEVHLADSRHGEMTTGEKDKDLRGM